MGSKLETRREESQNRFCRSIKRFKIKYKKSKWSSLVSWELHQWRVKHNSWLEVRIQQNHLKDFMMEQMLRTFLVVLMQFVRLWTFILVGSQTFSPSCETV